MKTGAHLPQAGADWACWALRHVEQLPALRPAQWDTLLRQAHRADVLARLAVLLDEAALLEAVAPAPRVHLRAALAVARAQRGEVRREAALIAEALAELAIPVILLKGAAYVLAGLPAAQGRLFSDVDILVPLAAINQAEGALMLQGWLGSHHDAYDQRYYREWMHELPPMEHMQRQTVLDVHHNILPLTARHPPDAALLIADSRPVAAAPGLRVLAPVDMVLHSMCHLLHNDELSHGLRDLSDLDLLLRHFGASEPGFWPALCARAERLQLRRVLHHGLWATGEFFATPVPAEVQAHCRPWGPGVLLAPLMRALWRRGLRGPHQDAALPGQGAALFLLYLRAHGLRMPPLMLLRHLSYKAWKRLAAPASGTAA